MMRVLKLVDYGNEQKWEATTVFQWHNTDMSSFL